MAYIPLWYIPPISPLPLYVLCGPHRSSPYGLNIQKLEGRSVSPQHQYTLGEKKYKDRSSQSHSWYKRLHVWLLSHHGIPQMPLTSDDQIAFLQLVAVAMGRRTLPAVRDLTRDGRWSTYDVSVLKLYIAWIHLQCFIPGRMRTHWKHILKLPSPTKLARLGHFLPASQAGRLAGPVFYVYIFSLAVALLIRILSDV
jgi:hypothetical protein